MSNRNFTKTADDSAHDIGEAINKTVHAGAEVAQQAMHSVNNAAKEVLKRAKGATETVTDFIEERPITSVLIAFAAGALAYRIMRR